MKEFDVVETAKQQRHLYLLQRVKAQKKLSAAELEELAEYEAMAKAKGKNKKKSRLDYAASQADADDTGEVLATQAEAAKYAGVSKRTIRNWVQAGMPQAGTKGYLKLYLNKFKSGGRPAPTGDKKRIQVAEADFKESKATLLQMELDLRQGRVIKVEDQEIKDVQTIMSFKRNFLGLGRLLAQRLASARSPRVCKGLVDKEVKKIIADYAGQVIDKDGNISG